MSVFSVGNVQRWREGDVLYPRGTQQVYGKCQIVQKKRVKSQGCCNNTLIEVT